ncbi:MAG: hypothetical protein AAGU02_09770, partial [Lawsonibacter sp.]
MDNTWKTLAEKLPKQPCEELTRDVMMDIYDENALGQNLLLYHREAVEILEEIQAVMCPEDWERRERTAERHWGARCTCSACGEDFTAGYVRRKDRRGITLFEGEDGQVYSGYAETAKGANEYLDGETLQCPCCWNTVEVVQRSELRHGRTYQVLQAEVVSVDQYTVIMYWLVSRYFDDTGIDRVLFFP